MFPQCQCQHVESVIFFRLSKAVLLWCQESPLFQAHTQYCEICSQSTNQDAYSKYLMCKSRYTYDSAGIPTKGSKPIQYEFHSNPKDLFFPKARDFMEQAWVGHCIKCHWAQDSWTVIVPSPIADVSKVGQASQLARLNSVPSSCPTSPIQNFQGSLRASLNYLNQKEVAQT